MASVDPEIQAFVPESSRWERISDRATELETEYPEPTRRPSLYGVPVGVKDIFHVDGIDTRAGSDLPPERLTGREGAVVERLRDAGAIVLGKTVTAEFAYFEPGPTRNPHNTAHTPGGSSSGSAAAVAAGLCPAAIGTQTIGSVIRPSAFCGVIGVKPSYGRVPTDGIIPVSPSLDQVGYFTQDIEGASLLAAILCEKWKSIPAPRRNPKLGIPDGAYLQQATDSGRRAFESSVGQLAEAGYEIERVDIFEDIGAINERHETLMAAEMAIEHERWYAEFADQYADATAELLERGHRVKASEIAWGREGRTDLRDSLEATMDEQEIDIWISPAAPGPAPEGIDDTGDPVMNLPWTHAGLPTISLPAGTVANGLPVGLQCAARFGADEELLAWAEGLITAL
jgi:Asp-tRNA(Asn)/Glu-tRNA(Gln) amidotransferase A subunit family amidase